MRKTALIPLMLTFLLSGCDVHGGETPNQNTDKELTAIAFDVQAKTINVGDSFTLQVSYTPSDATNKTLVWSSSASDVASVSNGNVTGLKDGSASIEAFADKNGNGVFDEGEPKATCAVTVKKSSTPATDYTITLDKTSVTMMMDHTETITATIEPKDSAFQVPGYSSSDEKVATVKDGTISPTGLGECDITVTYQNATATCHVKVNPWIEGDVVHVATLAFADKNVVLTQLDETYALSTVVTPANATNTSLTWTSSNDEIVEVDQDGMLTAKGYGSAIITAVTKDVSDKTAKISVFVKNSTESYGYDHYDNYYGELTWTDGADLTNKLHTIINNGYQPLKYTVSTANWETNQFADQDLYNFDFVDVVYDEADILKTKTNTGWQREHAFAASLMTGYGTGDAVSTNNGRATDFHNLLAANASGNTSRGNKNFGYANPDNASYQEKEAGYKFDNKNFEPSDTDKGRIARAIFYMGVMYNQEVTCDVTTKNAAGKTAHIPATYKPLQIVEDYIDYDVISFAKYQNKETEDIQALVAKYGDSEAGYGAYVTDTCKFAIGNLSTLIEWNSFTVDYLEYQHNESVYSHINATQNKAQGNRNPFVDYPELVEYVYGALKDAPGDLKYLKPAEEALDVDAEGVMHYAVQDVKTTFGVGEVFNSSAYTLKAVGHDLSISTPAAGADLTEAYTFVENDVGEKEMNIHTAINDIKVMVTVTAEKSFDAKDCKYFSGEPLTKTDYVTQLAAAKCTLALANSADISQYSKNGILIPSSAGTVTITSESLNNIDAVVIKTNTNSGIKFNMTMKIGDQTIYSGEITGVGRNNDPIQTPVVLSTKLSGVVTISITNFSANLYIASLGINAD